MSDNTWYEVLEEVDDMGLNAFDFVLLLFLYFHKDDNHEVRLGNRRLAERCRVSTGSIVKSKISLKNQELIDVVSGKNRHDTDVITVLWRKC